jgi:hypothetical protein
MTKIACVAVVKNEERHIAEWIAYQLVIGFDAVILLDNASTDATKAAAGTLAGAHDVRIFDWHVFDAEYQWRGYEFIVGHLGHEFDWLAFIDTDEFLALDPGLDLKTCLEALGDVAGVGVAWAMFGSSGHREMPSGLVIENYLYRSAASFGPNQHIKSIIRPEKMVSCRNPHIFHVNGPYVDLTGEILNLNPNGLLTSTPHYRIGKINHYFTRSWADWVNKTNRGYHDITRQLDLFETYDLNQIYDDSSSYYAPKVRAVLAGAVAEVTVRPPIAAPIIQPRDELNFDQVENVTCPQGFIIGWEWALLGNRLSSYANLFALSERTGIAMAFPQIMQTGDILDFGSDPHFYIHSPNYPVDGPRFDDFTKFAERIFADGFERYMTSVKTVKLAELDRITASGIVVFLEYKPEFIDLTAHEAAIQNFCSRGNGLIMPGAFWHQYLDMRVAASCGPALRKKLRVGRADGAETRSLIMAVNGDASLRIGVHMRRGNDYEGWQGGRYHFSIDQYIGIIHSIHRSLGDRQHCFYVCSDIKMDPDTFRGLPVCYDPASLEDDFAALCNCDYVVGPPSTFGTWSAFLGSGKRVILTQERMNDLAAWSPNLDAAVEIVFPTGGYLPGDTACAPV